jgi:hypothetical protein
MPAFCIPGFDMTIDNTVRVKSHDSSYTTVYIIYCEIN